MKNINEFKRRLKAEDKKIVMVSCYDISSAKWVEQSDVDAILIGDSVAMVVYGHPSTIYADVEMMIRHTEAVARGTSKFIVGDMPFGTFRKGKAHALDVAHALMKAGAGSVKLEGVWGHEDVIEHLVLSGVPVMGHLGYTPQSANVFGNQIVQGVAEQAQQDLLKQALRLQELGAFSVVFECVPANVAAFVRDRLSIPVIGIGAGAELDGQILVLPDLLGFSNEFTPKFLRKYRKSHEDFVLALDEYCLDVRQGLFPQIKESYHADIKIH